MSRGYQLRYWVSIGWDALFSKRGYYVLGYPKSGTNWLCLLIGSCLRLPVFEPWKKHKFFGGRYIYHVHRFLPSLHAKRRTIYLVRDGRDAIISRYHAMLTQPAQINERAQFARWIGCLPTAEDITLHLPAWIDFLRKSNESSIDWKRHVEIGLRRRFHTVKFGDLKERGVETLSGVVEFLTGEKPNPQRLTKIIEYHSFEGMRQRANGDSHALSFLRAGVPGEWRSVFDRRGAEAFVRYAGQTLISAGYEQDNTWIERIPTHTVEPPRVSR